MRPAPKADYCYYSVIDKSTQKEIFQLCYGTEVNLSFANQTTHGLDISIQKAKSTLTPNENDVVMIMDAKYSAKSDSKISKQNISYFGQWVRDLGVENAAKSKLQFDELILSKAIV